MGAIGMVGDFVVPSLLARSYPGYSNLRDTISTFGTTGSPVKAKTAVWLVMLDVFLLVFAVGQAMTFCFFTLNTAGFAVGLVAFVLFMISGKNGRGWLGMTGLWQRIYLAAMYAILLANAIAIRK